MSPKRPRTYRDGSTPRVCIVGAGPSGLSAAIQLQRQLGHKNFVLFEKAHDVGGAWLANKYPGCQVDIPALIYSFSFAQSARWSKLCPDRDEYWKYLQKTAKKYDVYRYARFGTAVTSLCWSEEARIWTVTTVDVKTKAEEVHEFNIAILGTGPLSVPYHPPEFEPFSGPKMHSAEWDGTIALENQVVGVVGTSSSGVQVIPSIAPLVKKLIIYVREPNYVFPKPNISLGWASRVFLKVCPWSAWALRACSHGLMDFLLAVYQEGTFLNKIGRFISHIEVRRHVKDKHLQKLLMPRYAPGLKVAAMAHASFYETFNRPNVELRRSGVAGVEGQEIVTEDGQVDRLDVLILCTGFRVRDIYCQIQITGLNGVDLMEKWKSTRPETFFSVTCAEAPNLFFLLGPNGSSGHGSHLFFIECEVNFVVNAIRTLMKRGAGSIRVLPSDQVEAMQVIKKREYKLVCMQPGPEGVTPTWMRNENGYFLGWPRTNTLFWWKTRKINLANFEFGPRRAKDSLGSEKYRAIEKIV